MKKIKLSIYFTFLLFTHFLMGDINVQMAVNYTNGNSISTWEDSTPFGNNIFASAQTGGIWSPATAIADPNTFPSVPYTAINSSGQMVVIWLGYDHITLIPSLYGSVYISGTWVTALLSDPSIEYVVGNHQVKIADNGVIVINWISYILSTGFNEARAIYAPTYGVWPSAITLP